MSRRRLAPMASRTAISRRRCSARPRSRFETLAQAMSRTSPTIVINRPVTATTPSRALGFTVARASGTTVTLRPLLSFGYSVSSRCAIMLRRAWAWATVTPGFSRPTVNTNRPRRSSYQLMPVLTCLFIAIGTHTSGRTPTSRPV